MAKLLLIAEFGGNRMKYEGLSKRRESTQIMSLILYESWEPCKKSWYLAPVQWKIEICSQFQEGKTTQTSSRRDTRDLTINKNLLDIKCWGSRHQRYVSRVKTHLLLGEILKTQYAF